MNISIKLSFLKIFGSLLVNFNRHLFKIIPFGCFMWNYLMNHFEFMTLE